MTGYHTRAIEKGVLGDSSKIREELEELEDAERQGARVLQLCELADLLGAMEAYVAKHFPNFGMGDLVTMSRLNRSAFRDGAR